MGRRGKGLIYMNFRKNRTHVLGCVWMYGCVDLWMCVRWITGTSMQPRHGTARHGTARHGTARYGIYTILAWAGLDWGLTHIQSLGQVIRESRINHPQTLGSGIPHTLSDKIYTNHRTTYPSETKLIPRVTANPRAIFTYTQGYSH